MSQSKRLSESCTSQKVDAETVFHVLKELQTVQPFPSKGRIAKNLGLSLPVLKSEIGKATGEAYSYVLSTIKIHREVAKFEQHGSAPNFQGGVLTLCTCKHQMRATRSAKDWQGVWVAGFTSSKIYAGRNWLFYLVKIDAAHEAHSDIWKAMAVNTRNAKAADTNFLGDIFRPKSPHPTGDARFTPGRYFAPTVHSHRQHRGDKGWQNDIHYGHADKYGHPSLLVGDPRNTFLWDEPMISFAANHCRNFFKWASLPELFAQLREAK